MTQLEYERNLRKISNHLKQIDELLPKVKGYVAGYKKTNQNYITVRLDGETYETLVGLARQYDLPLAKLVRECLIRGLQATKE